MLLLARFRNKETSAFMLLILLILCQAQAGKSENVSLSEDSLRMNLKIDISENGSASVNCSFRGYVSHTINLSIPKTVKDYFCKGSVESFSFFDGFDYNSIQIEPPSNGILNTEVLYFWLDCAVPFNGSYYVGSDGLLPMYPQHTTVESNITIIFPANATLLRCDIYETANETAQDRLHISFIENGYLSTEHDEFLPTIIFKQQFYKEDTALMKGANIILSYPVALSKWANGLFVYSDKAYELLLSKWGTRSDKNPLRINVVPAAAIVNAVAYYSNGEDSIYFPAHWVFGVDYSLFRPLQVLFHEIGHSFTDFDFPFFMSEGLAEYASHELFAAMSLNESKEVMEDPHNLQNPLKDPNFNSSTFFEWNLETPYYARFFFVVYDLVNFTGSGPFRDFLDLLEKKNFTFSGYSQRDGYELLVYYLNVESGKHATDFFRKYQYEVDESRLTQRISISTIAFGLEILVSLAFSWEVVQLLIKRRMRFFLLSLFALSAFVILSIVLFTMSLSVEFLMLDSTVLVICLVLVLFAVCFILVRRARSGFDRMGCQEH